MHIQTSPSVVPTLLLVDDEAVNLQILQQCLQQEHRLLFAKDGPTALTLAKQELPDLILLDVMMPEMSGYEVCNQLKAHSTTKNIPVIFVTALGQVQDELLGFKLGAVDYLNKPIHPSILQARIKNHLSLVQIEALRASRLEIIRCLGAAAEFKDNETGRHVIRMSHYAQILALAAGLTEHQADELLHAAPMHDIGKIGIPDAILQKTGKLSPDEWEIMRQHTFIGAQILGNHEQGLLHLARLIALYHHEKWDGSGYPFGLKGAAIPLAARIVALADVFDALSSKRPYKPAWSIEKTLAYCRAESGKHFDPALVQLLDLCLPKMLEIKHEWADEEGLLHDQTITLAANEPSLQLPDRNGSQGVGFGAN